MKIEFNKKEAEKTNRIKITLENGSEFRISVCHLSGGLIINKFDDDSSINIIPRVSNEIIIK